jgi:hypothetical protein
VAAHSYSGFAVNINYEKKIRLQELNIPVNLKQKLFDNPEPSLASGKSTIP